uniref:Putative toxin-antitoxin system toxin component, PIN family n=1 Tax=Candidatus Kentrum sp. DK TaxID=2126562 RepID=A0A450TL87_9GAMM|nr:MAG: putative toxin-antitoxin system toxin component, PIN family [Candidatus Kentron sp. DK]VFJ68756.1 MAG: putative toxin-antitoxin system toxin component, PIN family [Candidatus Kentron sp. DK]
MKLVVDTNIFFCALNPESRYHPIVEGIYSGRHKLLISTSILLEYEEILRRVFPDDLLEAFWLFILTSRQVALIDPAFHFQLPFADEDDQKFVDCAVCGGADFLITNDKHYNMLKDIGFPKVRVISGETFVDAFPV